MLPFTVDRPASFIPNLMMVSKALVCGEPCVNISLMCPPWLEASHVTVMLSITLSLYGPYLKGSHLTGCQGQGEAAMEGNSMMIVVRW